MLREVKVQTQTQKHTGRINKQKASINNLS